MYGNNNSASLDITTTTITTTITTAPPRKAMAINLTTYLHYWNMPKTAVLNTNSCSTTHTQQPITPPPPALSSTTTRTLSSPSGSRGSNSIGGRIVPLLERLIEKARLFDWLVLVKNVMETVHWCDLLLLLAWGWLSVPAAAFLYKSLLVEHGTNNQEDGEEEAADADADAAAAEHKQAKNPTIVQQHHHQQQQQPLLAEASSLSSTSSTLLLSSTKLLPSSSSLFWQSHFHVVVCKFSQLGRLCTFVYLFDCLVVAFQTTMETVGIDEVVVVVAGHQQDEHDDLLFWSSPLAQIVTVVWATMTVSQLVTYLIDRFVEHRSNQLLPNNTAMPFNIATASTPEIQERSMRKLELGVLQSRLQVTNAIFHILLASWTFYILFELVEAEIVGFMGHSESSSSASSSSSSSSSSSIIALGSVLLGWAAKDWAAMIFAGITLSLSNRVQEGNEITFVESNMSGFIHHIGWMQTTIRGYNEIFTVVPNTQLITQRVRNISRTFKCQVKENLRICYKDAHKLRTFLPDVLEEVKASCPEVISDGTRPFRAVWVGYGEDHIKIMVDVHFDLRPTGQKYWENKQEVMFAIYRAAEKHDITFVTTMRWPMVGVAEPSDDKSSTP